MDALTDSVWGLLSRGCMAALVAIPVAWVACLCLQTIPQRIHCWVWRICYAKVLLSAFCSISIGIPLLSASDSDNSTFPQSTSILTVEPIHENPGFDVKSCLCVAWCLMATVGVIRSFVEWKRSRRIRSHVESIPKLVGSYRSISSELGIARPPNLASSGLLHSPALVGLLSPSIVLPQGLENQLDDEALELILRHELAHYERGDALWSILPRLANCILFFHPLVWLAAYRWRLAQEAACDSVVLQGCREHSQKYFDTLLAVM